MTLERDRLIAEAEKYITTALGKTPCEHYDPDLTYEVPRWDDPLCAGCHFPKADHLIRSLLTLVREDGLQAANQQLAYWWFETGRCPCGARRESPRTHPHVIGCSTRSALRGEDVPQVQPEPEKEAGPDRSETAVIPSPTVGKD